MDVGVKMQKIDLNGTWKLVGISPENESFEIHAEVPGSALQAVLSSNVEKDLDVFYRDHAESVQKYENYNWIYSKAFVLKDMDRPLCLVLEKLDTYCDIFVNGEHLAACDNAFISHAFDISGLARLGENTVEIRFCSPVPIGREGKERPCAFGSYERLYTRRPQCTYGWDWTMRFVTCGIGNVYLEAAEEGMKVESSYIYTKSIDEDAAELVVDLDFSGFENGAVVWVDIIDPDGQSVAECSRYNEEPFMRIHLDVKNPRLWYPNGYGESPLYTVVIRCEDRVLYSEKIGIRTVKILELTDEVGSESYNRCAALKQTPFSKAYDKNESFSGFILKINGKKILCKGANWVPCEPFARGNTDQKVTALLELAKAAGVNMLRVWGGGDFETEHFYDECARLGIMVTQDFLMACGEYPEEESWFLNQLKKEAEYVVKLIRNKACLVWWSGDNENAVNGCDTDREYSGRASAYKAIAPVIYKKDYSRRFLASSPYGGKKYASNTKGTTHNTQFLGDFFDYVMRGDVSNYKDDLKQYSARFIAEEPILGAATEACLLRFMTAQDIYGEDLSMWLYHTKTNPGLKEEIFAYILAFARGILGDFKGGEDRFFKLQYLQYEWLRVSMERVRREKWFCSGVIYWMLNDCWPAAAGWSIIDYYARPKAAYYSFKRSAKPLIVSVDLEDGKYRFHLCNDGKELETSLLYYVISKEGKVAYRFEAKTISVPENASIVAMEVNEDEIPEDCFIAAETGEDRAFYKKGRLDIYPASERIEYLTVKEDRVTVKANAYIHALELCADAVFEDNFFSLLPGEERTVRFTRNGMGEIRANAYAI